MRRLAWIFALVPAAVGAQQGETTIAGAWFDGAGNEVDLPGKFASYDHLKPVARPVADLVALFRDACLTAPIGTDAARPAVDARAGWGFRYLDRDAGVPGKGRLDGWQAADVSLTSQPRTWPLSECNVLAARIAREDMATVVASVSAAVGASADKRYRARAADGRRLDGDAARWSVKGPGRVPRRVYASSYLDRNGAYALHLGLTEARPE